MKRFLLFGLGNPGKEFEHTRHNIGIDSVMSWMESVKDAGAPVSEWKTHEQFHTKSLDVTIGDTVVTILSPLVFMNDSGRPLVLYLRYTPIPRENILIVHDELELPLGEIDVQRSGSAHGHNGVRSIHEHLGGTDIARIRIGIGRPVDTSIPVEKFVLATFTPEEKQVLREKETEIRTAINSFLSLS